MNHMFYLLLSYLCMSLMILQVFIVYVYYLVFCKCLQTVELNAVLQLMNRGHYLDTWRLSTSQSLWVSRI